MTTSRKLRFHILDVFTDTRYLGNPLAIVCVSASESHPLFQEQKREIAGEFNLSETVFMHESHLECDDPIKIDVVELGDGDDGQNRREIVIQTKAGNVPAILQGPGRVRLKVPIDFKIYEPTRIPSFKVAQSEPRAEVYTNGLNGVKGVASVVKGTTFVPLELTSENMLRKLQGVNRTLDAPYPGEWRGRSVGLCALCEQKDGVVRTRMMRRTFEDPVTGAAASALGEWLGGRKGLGNWVIEMSQGAEVGRRSTIEVRVEVGEKREIQKIEIELEGEALHVAEGIIILNGAGIAAAVYRPNLAMTTFGKTHKSNTYVLGDVLVNNHPIFTELRKHTITVLRISPSKKSEHRIVWRFLVAECKYFNILSPQAVNGQITSSPNVRVGLCGAGAQDKRNLQALQAFRIQGWMGNMADALATHPYLASAAGLVLARWLYTYFKDLSANPRRLPNPPGPRNYPVIGSLLEAPLSRPWLVYDKWFKNYGDLIYFEIVGKKFLIVGSVERANDLFEKRSTNYSDRPHLIMVVDLMGWDYNWGLIPYGPLWRHHRRIFHQYMNSTQLPLYLPTQVKHIRAFLRRVLANPDDFFGHSRHLFAALITDVAWFPGAGWKRKAAYYKRLNDIVSRGPFETVKQNLRNGTAVPSIAASLIEALPDDPKERAEGEKVAINVAGTAFLGGADTTVSTIQSFFLAMCLHPEIQKKGQEELDSVLLGKRLPDLDDRPSLPYVNAIAKEAIRWHPVLPLGVPHMTTDDDEFNGWFIPKGTIVIGSAWSILHDPEAYKDPLEFIPERFLRDGQLDPSVRDPSITAFGFGRRICPGRHMSDISLFLTIASFLSCFEIRAPLDENGNPIKPSGEYTSGTFQWVFLDNTTPLSR
ncbi:O-methylsterigmatocystin oxidoreductase [Leucoagaricus sp. SymC.cos]|nr:O-methylsterigmatocystin oxidoreductase [Leucoagaricus sp. SymC.cos]